MFQRNDSAATTFAGQNLTASAAAVDSKGRVLTAISDVPGEEAFIGLANISYQAITDSFTIFLDNPGFKIKILSLSNMTDEFLILSLDGETPAIFLPSGSDLSLDLGANGRSYAGDMYVQYSGIAPSMGMLIATVTI